MGERESFLKIIEEEKVSISFGPGLYEHINTGKQTHRHVHEYTIQLFLPIERVNLICCFFLSFHLMWLYALYILVRSVFGVYVLAHII